MRSLFTFFLSIVSIASMADTYVVVGKESKIFDQPNVRSYATTNTSGNDVVLSPGMVFKNMGSQSGWVKIEYTPGLNAFLLENQIAGASQLSIPKEGNYKVTNDPATNLTLTTDNGNWTANDGKKTYQGVVSDKSLIFNDSFNNTMYSATVVSGTIWVYSYNNDITKFF